MNGKLTMVYSPVNGICVGDGHIDDVCHYLAKMIAETDYDFSIKFASYIIFERVRIAVQQGEIPAERVHFAFPNEKIEPGSVDIFTISDSGYIAGLRNGKIGIPNFPVFLLEHYSSINLLTIHPEKRNSYTDTAHMPTQMLEWMKKRISDSVSWGHGKDYDV